jgi:hypothetical protein
VFMAKTNDVVSWLYLDAASLCSRFVAVHDEIQALSNGDSHRAALEDQLQNIRVRIMKRYGVLGVHFPDVSPRLGKLISHDQIVSSEYRRKYLTLEDVLEALLEGHKGEASVADFWAFVSYLGISELPTEAEALDAIVEANPGRFGLQLEGDKRCYVLRLPVDDRPSARRVG